MSPDKHKGSLGINVGNTSVKMVLLDGAGVPAWADVMPHEGDVPGTVRRMIEAHKVEPGVHALVTGPEGRRQVKIIGVIEPVVLEKALEVLKQDVRAVVSIGGEDLVVYALDQNRRVAKNYAGNKCASGTGEFFFQQLKRMDLNLDSVDLPEVAGGKVCRLSMRCSVFMKSDCTHKLNKGEVTKHDIVLSLSNVMARKVVEFLGKAKISSGRVLLAGGCTRNPHLVKFIREGLPGVEFVLTKEAPYLEALGAAHLAVTQGSPLPPMSSLFGASTVVYARARDLNEYRDKVRFFNSPRGELKKGGRYILGVDGGSTTTKIALIDGETKQIVAAHYGRTLGDPVAALKDCLVKVKEQVKAAVGDPGAISISVVATTGSSRELLGVYCGTRGVYNEIVAHTVGSTFYDPDIDTIFEIGGQDAKYVTLRNHVPVDYAMNEACSAGTGSFLEEAAAGDLDIHSAEEIGPIALQASAPLKFGEHCSAFINSDIRKAIQQGATRPDIVAGIILSIVSNYLNRVVGNRRIGKRVVLQGGVAKNPAVPLAFAALLGKPVVVPPNPELLGCFGVGLLAMRKIEAGELEEGSFTLDTLLNRTIVYEREFRCQACENNCPIRVMLVGGERYQFGGRCNKYANLRKKFTVDEKSTVDWVEVRRKLYFEKHAPDPATLERRTDKVVGIPEAFGVHSLYPLYSWFFHNLGVEAKLFGDVSEKGLARVESNFCYPAEVAHGLMPALLEAKPDFIFLPQFKRMPSFEKEVHATFCPLTQGLPYYLRTAFGLDDAKILRPILDLDLGFESGLRPMAAVAERLGFTRSDAVKAWAAAIEKQEECWRESREIGRRVIAEAKEKGKPVLVLFGRPYNALTSTLNMSVPRKFLTRGYSVLPFDFLPIEDQEIYPNMYWYYGQQNMKGSVMVKKDPNLFPCYITNFSCAPDSFILHYLRWVYNTKPFLILELDSHTADAGVDTRIEAFLDIIEGFRKARTSEEPMMVEADWAVRIDGLRTGAVNRLTGEFRGMKHPGLRLIWPCMGIRSTGLVNRISRSYGIDSISLPVPNIATAGRARAVASGKECIPALLVLGSFLDYFAQNPPDADTVYMMFMPSTTGPCRVGQYGVFYQNLFQELGYRNVLMLSPSSDNSYTELGKDFSRRAWLAVCLGDLLVDIEYALRALARDPVEATAEFEAVYGEMLDAAEKGSGPLLGGLKKWASRLAAIPLRMPLAEARKVMVVGEIFVRRDDYSVGTLMSHLAGRGIVGKVSGIAEWINYLDFERSDRLLKVAKRMGFRGLFSRELRELAGLKMEMAWKRWVHHRFMDGLWPSGLVPDAPRDMAHIMRKVESFTAIEFDTEASLSVCEASAAMEDGYHGVAVIAPFACLPGRLVESIYAPWARTRDYPVICLENDGNPYPPNVLNRIEIFAHNVSRRALKRETAPEVRAG